MLKLIIKILTVVADFCLVFSSARAAGPGPVAASEFSYQAGARFQRFTVEDGLPSATVLSVLQDKQGFMWFATENGLSRYDGSRFTNYYHDPNNPNSLSNNNTFALIESSDGLLWIGTDPGGLNVFNPATGQFTHYRHDPKNPNSLPDDSVWSLLETRDGLIWVGTRNGLSRFDRVTQTFKNYLPDAKNPRALAAPVVYRIYQDSAGVLWLGTHEGLQRYHPETDDFTTFKNDPANPQSLSSSNVWAMREDSQGNFWVGTRGGGLNLFNRAAGTFTAYRHSDSDPYSLSNDRLWNIYEDSAHNLWVATENGGLNLFDAKTGHFTSFQNNPNDPFSISHNDLFWMTEDRSGVLWVTSRYGGVNALHPALQRFGWHRHIPEDPNTISANNVYAALPEKDGVLWIGTFGHGLNRYDSKTGEMKLYQNNPDDPASLSNNNIYNIFRDPQGVLWVATSGGGLNRLDEATGQFTVFRHDNKDIATLKSDFLTNLKSAGPHLLWVGTLGYGLDLFDTSTGKVIQHYANDPANPYSLTEDTVYDMAIDSDGKVWIATARGGLELLDPQTGQFTHQLNDPENINSIASNTVHALYLDETNQEIWAATAGGLSRLNLKTNRWETYSAIHGLASDMITGVQPGGDGSLWVSTSRGISHLNPLTGIARSYNASDGLQGNQFNIGSSALGPDGEIFFGGPHGLNHFHNQDIFDNLYLPTIVFTNFELFNQPVPPGSDILPAPIEYTRSITLQPDQSVFTIEFVALSYQISSKNLYRYKMDGFDKDWSPAKNIRQATYTNLSPGTYTFLVYASNNDNQWGQTPAQLQIIILPPWWQTEWFETLAVLVVIGAIFAGAQVRIWQVQKTNRDLEARVEVRTRELSDEICLRRETENQLRETNEALQTKLAEITELQIRLREQAIHDSLTGLYNRHYLDDTISTELSRASRSNYPVTFMLVDLDHFKNVNDSYGHQAGDRVLQAAAQMLNKHTRQGDYVFRYGGEEFLLILPATNARTALQRAEQLCADLESMTVMFEQQPIRITASVGVAIYSSDGGCADDLLHHVDDALYQAKENGRNCVMLAPNTRKLLAG